MKLSSLCKIMRYVGTHSAKFEFSSSYKGRGGQSAKVDIGAYHISCAFLLGEGRLPREATHMTSLGM